MKKNIKDKEKKTISLIQIILLVISIIAISWMIGSEVNVVKANGGGNSSCTPSCSGKECGSDGCSGSCGTCTTGTCNSAGKCETTQTNNQQTDNSPCTLTFCCLTSVNYICGSKRNSAGVCVLDDLSVKWNQKCDYGCEVGICKLKPTENPSEKDPIQTVSNVVNSVEALDNTVDQAKGLLTDETKKEAGDVTKQVVDKELEDAAKKASDKAIKKAAKEGLSKEAQDAAGKEAYDKTIAEGLSTTGSTTSWLLGGETLAGSITAIVAWAAVAYLAGRYLGAYFGLNTKNSQSLGYALAAGTATGLILTSTEIMGSAALTGPQGLLIGVVVAAVVFVILYRDTSTKLVTYNCYQWEPKNGQGLTPAQKKDRCELCNSQEYFQCTEYQCRSLGAGCLLINDENTHRQLCIWNNTNDILPPVITPWKDALLENFEYTPDNTISPPDRGVRIAYTGKQNVTRVNGIKCAPAFTPVSFGVKLDEPAKCKISPINVRNYSAMPNYFMGMGINDYNHSFILSLPSQEALDAENVTVNNGGKYELYVRCEDTNGNSNPANFVFKFCISQGPDTTPPVILGTNILNNQPIATGQTSINTDLYVNEPAECRWSHLDKNYDAMEESMVCDTSVTEVNAQMSYKCLGNLTGLKNNQNNTFYFRCKDQPHLKGTANESKRNVNTESYVFNLIGTSALVIESISPNGTTIHDSTDTIKVELIVKTFGGFNEGRAMCAFSDTGASGTYIDFFNGYDVEPFSQYENKQELWLGEGNYTYFIQCRDKGGNMDSKKINFSVELDTEAPTIVRVYKEDESLKLVTNEEAECFYSNTGCSYDLAIDGTTMDSSDALNHLTAWSTEKNLYIKCKDKYGNQPEPDVCSLIVRPFEIPEIQTE
jgi:hypothetical protein